MVLKRALVIGASSGMGAELVRRLAADGHVVAAVARRADRLQELADEVNAGGTRRVFPVVHDVTDTESVEALFERVVVDLDGLDLVIYCAGVMPRIGIDEYPTALDRQVFEVNVIGAMAWLNPAAERMAHLGGGTLVGIGSVAGDRGRVGNPAYCASKAALETYMEALRNRLAPKGVQVLTVKPGPVRTPMTQGLDKLPMVIDVSVAVDQILTAIAKRKTVVYVPKRWGVVMAVIRAIPSSIFQRLGI
jgi:short-subunit dehydrogenase